MDRLLKSFFMLIGIVTTLLFSVVVQAGDGSVSETTERKILVLTSLPAIYSIASALSENTSIRIENIPNPSRSMSAQKNYFSRRAEKLHDLFKSASAVITMGKLWHGDPLFTAARSANIYIVEIDASRPWSHTLEGITLIQEPLENAAWDDSIESGHEKFDSLYYWLSPANAVRSATIIASDLERLQPSEAEKIRTNLNALTKQLLLLKSEYESKFAELADVTLFSLASEFVYLTTDMGLYVDGYFLKQDIHWTEEDIRQFESYLRDNDIKTVIHKWQPDQKILTAIESAGATLVELDSGEIGLKKGRKILNDSLQRQLRGNLERLYGTLSAANKHN